MARNNSTKAHKQDVKPMIILLSGPWMIICALGVFQTIEWHISQGTPIPSTVYLLLSLLFFWCLSALSTSNKRMRRAIKRFEKLAESLF